MQEPKSVLIFISVIAGLIFNITYVMMMGKIVHVESNFASTLTLDRVVEALCASVQGMSC